jgi:hypothetical protein
LYSQGEISDQGEKRFTPAGSMFERIKNNVTPKDLRDYFGTIISPGQGRCKYSHAAHAP